MGSTDTLCSSTGSIASTPRRKLSIPIAGKSADRTAEQHALVTSVMRAKRAELALSRQIDTVLTQASKLNSHAMKVQDQLIIGKRKIDTPRCPASKRHRLRHLTTHALFKLSLPDGPLCSVRTGQALFHIHKTCESQLLVIVLLTLRGSVSDAAA